MAIDCQKYGDCTGNANVATAPQAHSPLSQMIEEVHFWHANNMALRLPNPDGNTEAQ